MLKLVGKSGSIAVTASAVLTLILAGLPNSVQIPQLHYLLPIHTVLEAFSAILAILTFTVGWRTLGEDRSGVMALLGCLFLGAGILNLGHLFSFPGMPDFITPNSFQKTILLSYAGRGFSMAALLSVALKPTWHGSSNTVRRLILSATLALVAIIVWVCIFREDWGPLLINAKVGATSNMFWLSVMLTVLSSAASVILIFRHRAEPEDWIGYLAASGFLLSLGQIDLMLYRRAADWTNVAGHLSLVLGTYYAYQAVFLRSVYLPMKRLHASERSLRHSQKELAIIKAAMDRAKDYLYIVDPSSGYIIYANEGACRRMGYSRSEMLKMRTWELNPSMPKPITEEITKTVRRDNFFRFETAHTTKFGETFPVEVTITLIHDEDQEFYYSSVRDISDRKIMEEKLAETAKHLRRVIDSMPYFISLLTTDGRFIDANKMVMDVWSLSESELRGYRMDELLAQKFPAAISERLADAVRRASKGETVQFDIHVEYPIGSEQHSAFYIAPVYGNNGEIVNLIATSISINERIVAEKQLKLASTAFDHSAEAILITDGDIQTLSVNRAFGAITGFEADEVIGHVPPLFEAGQHLQSMLHSLEATGNWSGEVEWQCRDGRLCFEWVTVTKVLGGNGAVSNFIVIFSDITEKKRTEEHIQYLAYYDPLTSLPNRVLLEDRVKQALATAKREEHKVAIIFMDLDHFKTINDSLGHHRGDKILAEVGKRLKRSVREMDTVARLGGDEFIILLPNLHEASEAATISQKLLIELQLPYLIGGSELRLTVSAGVSVFPDDGIDFSRLIMNADAAMYHAKAVGRNNVQFFVDEMNRRAADLLATENRLRRAIDNNEFILHYQPQVDLWSGTVIGLEALVRWNDPELGLVPPGDFIPVAEERGLIDQIGRWVLREACRQSKQWQDAGLTRLPVAVNISANEFRQKDLVDNIRAVLSETGLDAQYLELEVTETVVMYDAEQMISTLEELRAIGVYLSVDDFGTGYSSLSYLKRFPIDKIKIDRSFVRDIPQDKDDYSIVRAIIGLAQQLGLKVVAEGVETQEQLAALRESGCDHFQGFLFSRPLPPAEVEKLLREKRRMVVLSGDQVG